MKDGDIVQITNEEHSWFPSILIVSEVKPWGIQAYLTIPLSNQGPGDVEFAYIRLKYEDIEHVGCAVVINA